MGAVVLILLQSACVETEIQPTLNLEEIGTLVAQTLAASHLAVMRERSEAPHPNCECHPVYRRACLHRRVEFHCIYGPRSSYRARFDSDSRN